MKTVRRNDSGSKTREEFNFMYMYILCTIQIQYKHKKAQRVLRKIPGPVAFLVNVFVHQSINQSIKIKASALCCLLLYIRIYGVVPSSPCSHLHAVISPSRVDSSQMLLNGEAPEPVVVLLRACVARGEGLNFLKG